MYMGPTFLNLARTGTFFFCLAIVGKMFYLAIATANRA